MAYFRYSKGTESGSEPVSLAEAKEHLNILHTDKDTEVTALITQARTMFENMGGRNVLISTTYTAYGDEWPNDVEDGNDIIWLDRYPVTAVASVKYYDSDNVQQTMVLDTDYRLDLVDGRIELIDKPSLYQRINAIEIAFTAGYTSTTIPADIKRALLLMIGDLFTHREDPVRASMTAAKRVHGAHSRETF